MTMYIVIIINMYDPQMMKTLDSFSKMMPDLMASVGMNTGAHTLLGFKEVNKLTSTQYRKYLK